MSPATSIKWLKRIRSTTVVLWIYFFVLAMIPVETGPHGPGAPLSAYPLPLLLCAWVLADARERQISLCYDFDTFVAFFWPVATPLYLFRSRGWRGIFPIICFVAIWATASAL